MFLILILTTSVKNKQLYIIMPDHHCAMALCYSETDNNWYLMPLNNATSLILQAI